MTNQTLILLQKNDKQDIQYSEKIDNYIPQKNSIFIQEMPQTNTTD